MAAHVLLIDAMNLIRRIFAVQERPFKALNELSEATKAQVIHNTLAACTNALEKLTAEHQPTHALMIFDSQQPCWRYQVYPDYKKGRSKMPEYLAKALPKFQDAFLEQQIDSLVPDQDEADDIIATLAIKVALRQQHVTVVSTDKCFLSLLSQCIRVYDYFNRKFLDESYVIDKFNVRPSQLIDLWTLTGDTTNKIPGIAGVGVVTASKLLQQYQSLDALLVATDLKATMKATLANNQEQLALSKQLLTFRTNIPLGFNLRDIRLGAEVQAAELDC